MEAGMLVSTHGPRSSAVPTVVATIYKREDGYLYVSDPWFGSALLPGGLANGQVVETRPGRYGKVCMFGYASM